MRKESQQYDRGAENSRTCPGHDQADVGLYPDECYQGDYLKELQLSEGRATGIPTIQEELRRNSSEPARIETDEGRTYFLIEIPCREGFGTAINPQNEAINEAINEVINKNALSVLLEISKSPHIKRKALLELIDISKATLERTIKQLSSDPLKLIEYQGSLKTGGYTLTEKGREYVQNILIF